jgi:hypothetical protein
MTKNELSFSIIIIPLLKKSGEEAGLKVQKEKKTPNRKNIKDKKIRLLKKYEFIAFLYFLFVYLNLDG